MELGMTAMATLGVGIATAADAALAVANATRASELAAANTVRSAQRAAPAAAESSAPAAAARPGVDPFANTAAAGRAQIQEARIMRQVPRRYAERIGSGPTEELTPAEATLADLQRQHIENMKRQMEAFRAETARRGGWWKSGDWGRNDPFLEFMNALEEQFPTLVD
jgi:hypothetical protein